MSFLKTGTPASSDPAALALSGPGQATSRGPRQPPSEWHAGSVEPVRAGIFAACANPSCHSGWLRLWRGRSVPVFEDGWTCSLECTAARLRRAVAREMEGQGIVREVHRHRIPLGLMMMEQGWISGHELRLALEAQKKTGTGRLGQWLVKQGAASDEMIARALGLQWSCPVLSVEHHENATLATAIPRLFLDAFGALPLRVAAEKVLHLGFEESLDRVLALAVERMTGLRVECGIVPESTFRPVHARMLETSFPLAELVEAVSQPAAAYALAKSVERSRPVASRLVRLHDCLWMRLWTRPQQGALPEVTGVQDVICSIGAVG